MDPNQSSQQIQQSQQQQQSPPQPSTSRKRKKNDSGNDEPPTPAEPRRLRRSHEACARCRSKKIKCDAKHPKCTACATAGTPCHQEDRYRQTLTLRGHTERIERQLIQCEALLKRHHPGFDLNNLDEILAREGIEIDPNAAMGPASFQFNQASPSSPQPPKNYVYPSHMAPPGYPVSIPFGAPPGAYPPPHMQMQGPPPGPYSHMYPPFQHPHPMHPPPPVQPRPPSATNDIKGQDPQSNDMTSTQALARNFGVSPVMVSGLKLGPGAIDKEDLAVGSSGLISGRDRDMTESSLPRNAAKWISVSMRRNSVSSAPPGPASSTISVWLPKDRTTTKKIVDVYFDRLNRHRPVFFRHEFEHTLNALYDGQSIQHDPGYLCSLYLILALGTLSELNHRATEMDKDGDGHTTSPTSARSLMPHDWPDHQEFFEQALAVKPDLRVTISSLQALMLLHWYLYTERQGRTLWRLVGSLVRLCIELGLHHDPTAQGNTFTEEECQLRIRLWGIVMVHDRGTSILLGRPLAISPSDSNTPRPIRGKNGQLNDFSEHFLLSPPVAEIQADIINSLYTPTRQSPDAIMRHANRIIKSMVEFRRHLPESYKWYFGGTEDWPLEKKSKLVQDMTEDQGLTLLKIGIARILLLRALFNSKELQYEQRHKALDDAVVASHNIIVAHNQLICFPDIAFFVSPIPLHIAAMVILYGHMSQCNRLTRQTAIEDVWMALDMLPRFRWRWERKDAKGGHPLIAKLAEQILKVNLRQVGPARDAILIPEQDWDTETIMSPSSNKQQIKSQQSTPTMAHPVYPAAGPVVYGPHPHGAMSKGVNGASGDKHLVELPPSLFYPFYPENSTQPANGAGGATTSGQQQEFNTLLAAAAAQPDGAQESFMLDENLSPAGSQHQQQTMHMWMNTGEHAQRGMQYAVPQT